MNKNKVKIKTPVNPLLEQFRKKQFDQFDQFKNSSFKTNSNIMREKIVRRGVR